MASFTTGICIVSATDADADYAPLVAQQVTHLFNGVETIQRLAGSQSLPETVVACVILGSARVDGYPWVRLTLDNFHPRHHEVYTHKALCKLAGKCEALKKRLR